ncbi:TRAP transporter small permease [Rhodoligotrophos defluvii]|uniref:TRAP transporter small permease n=1 Tax=Rhodoligotrophos defluvii TaxID=2561934 RepID=UPI0010C98E13|nr:TRAP transporter small permease [Rhodoligotrophos defluvii]
MGLSERKTASSFAERLLRVYNLAVTAIGVVLMTTIVAVMGSQVFFRYVLNDSLIWAEEFSSYMLVLISFLLLGAAFQRGEMMNIELLMARLPPRLRAAANVPISLAMIGFLLVLSYYSYRFALLNRTTSIPALDFIISSLTGETRTVVVSRFWLYLTLPIGMCILALHLAVAMMRDLAVAVGRMSPADQPRYADAGD